jgi:hypothetical protein
VQPTYADFSHTPPRVSNADLEYHHCQPAADHVGLDNGGSITLHFELDAPEKIAEATLVVQALVSRLERHPGFAPMDIIANGKTDRPVIKDWAIPGGGDLPQVNTFVVPVSLLRKGRNTLVISSSEQSTSILWVYAVFLDSVYERDKSAKALAVTAPNDRVSVYTTARRLAGAETWEDTAPLALYLRGEGETRIEHFSWRDQDGTETSLTSSQADFVGSRRHADGRLYEYRGTLETTRPAADPAFGDRMQTYRTHHNWGDGWHPAADLAVMIQEDGSAAVTSLVWRDVAGIQGMVMFSPDGTRFAGTHQRVGEGPVGYQGRSY